MKNCLIVLAVLLFCFFIAAVLTVGLGTNWGRGFKGGDALIVGRWTYFDDSEKYEGLEVVVLPDSITVEVPDPPNRYFKQYTAKGQWRSHAFYADSKTDSSAPVMVANELPNEDLEVSLGYFSPSLPDKVTCVLFMRNTDGYHPYPTYASGLTVTYPPPKGLFRRGMLEADMRTLPWQAKDIELSSDGFDANGNRQDDPHTQTYKYHSDRSDLPELLVTVYHGRVIQVVGGAEETSEIPYTQPAPPSLDDTGTTNNKDTTDGSLIKWLFTMLFSK